VMKLHNAVCKLHNNFTRLKLL